MFDFNSKMNIRTLFIIAIFLKIQSIRSSDPFYLIAHMVNNRASLDWSLKQGANAIESDFKFNSSGYPSLVEHDHPCDCTCAKSRAHICHNGLKMKCGGPDASRNIIEHVEDVASRNGIALYYIDSKLDREIGKLAGMHVITFLDKHLFDRGYRGNVLISVAKMKTFDYIQSAVMTAKNSVYNKRYYFTVDEENFDYKNVISKLSRLTNRRIYATGNGSCSTSRYFTGFDVPIHGKIQGEHGLTIAWTIDSEFDMKQLINRGVNAILTNRVGQLKKVVQSLGLTLATSSTSIPLSIVNFS